MNLKCSSHKGGILLLTMILMVSLVVFATVFLSSVMVNNKNAMSQIDNEKALYIAEAGMNKAIYNIQQDNLWRTTAYSAAAGVLDTCVPHGSTSPCKETFGSGTYTMWVEAGTGTNLLVTSKGVLNGFTRTVQAQTISTGHGIVDGTWRRL